MNFNMMCRVCLKTSEDMSSIFQYYTNDTFIDLSLKMKICSETNVTPGDKLPHKICTKCIELLNNAYLYKTLSEKSDRTLKEMLQNHDTIKQKLDKSVRDFVIDNSLNPTYNCISCDKIYINKYTYNRHIMMKHSNINSLKKFKCYGCDKSFQTKWNRLFHEQNCKNISEKTVYECRKCPQTYKNRKEFDHHLKSHKPPDKHNLLIHISDVNTYQCANCLRTFKTKSSLIQHIKLHGDVKFICEVCGRIFKRQDYLKAHLSAHSGIKNNACPHCDFRSNQRSTLIIHMRTHFIHHRFTCDLCGYSCNSNSNLLAHRRRHDGIKSYKCKLCTKSFGYQKSLKEHFTISHEGLKQCFSCDICKTTYSRKRGLVRHMNKKHI